MSVKARRQSRQFRDGGGNNTCNNIFCTMTDKQDENVIEQSTKCLCGIILVVKKTKKNKNSKQNMKLNTFPFSTLLTFCITAGGSRNKQNISVMLASAGEAN